MTPRDIRATVASFWMTTPEVELLSCIALALADILEHLDQMQKVSSGPFDQAALSPMTSDVRIPETTPAS